MNQNRRGYEGYRRSPNDGRDAVLCVSCNVTLKARGMTMHKRSVLHRQNKRIRALLGQPCITQVAIAQRLGVTTQRVQQIMSRLLKIDGRERQEVCTLKRMDTRRQSILETDSLLSRVREMCGAFGLVFEPIEQDYYERPISKRYVTINGWRCKLLTAHLRDSNTVNVYYYGDPADADFFLYSIKDDARWIVIPRDRLPKTQTMFRLKTADLRLNRNGRVRHDWRDYIDAWHLLKTSPMGDTK